MDEKKRTQITQTQVLRIRKPFGLARRFATLLHSPLRGSLSQTLGQIPRCPRGVLDFQHSIPILSASSSQGLKNPGKPGNAVFARAFATTTHEVGSETRLRRVTATPPVRSDGKASDEQQIRRVLPQPKAVSTLSAFFFSHPAHWHYL